MGTRKSDRSRWPMGWRHDLKTKQNKTKQNKTKQNKTKQNKNLIAVSRSSDFKAHQSFRFRVVMLFLVGYQHLRHTGTKTSWKSKNLVNQSIVWSMQCQLISEETTV
jgi:ABC-type Fe3+-citrate transport system substrate-binding protein